MKKYIFRMDKPYPDDDSENAVLEAYDGMERFAEVSNSCDLWSGTEITFNDGYKNYAFVYEPEEA